MPTYAIDPDQTTLAVSVRRLLTGHGTFARVTGAVRADERGTLLSVEVSIDARSLRTGISSRDAHLMSPDFLNVRRYPISMFSSQYVEQMQVDRYLIHGLLRLNGREHPVMLAATLEPIDGSAGARRAHVSGALPRSAFAIPQNPVLRAILLPMIGDEVAIAAEVGVVLVSEGRAPATHAVRQSGE